MKAVECGTLIDGLDDEPVCDGLVLVSGERVVEAGPREGIAVPDDAEVIDHSEGVVVPGLIDAHLHLILSDRTFRSRRSFRSRPWPSFAAERLSRIHVLLSDSISGVRTFSEPFARLTKSLALSTARATADLRRLLQAGFTSARDVGSATGIGLREAVEEGEIDGPRIYTSGPKFSQTAGPSDHNSLPYPWTTSQNPQSQVAMETVVDGVDECRKAARKRIREGVDLLKIFGTGAGFHGLGQPEHSAYTPAEIQTFAEEAHRVGVPLAAHLIGEEGTETAVGNGVDTVEHGWYTNDETVESMVEEDVTMVPTLYTIHRFAHAGTAENTPPRFEDLGGPEKAKRAEESAIESARRAYEAGVPIALGTDAMGNDLLPHGENAREVELLVEQVGFDEMDAIRAATSVAARAIGDNEIGAIAGGRYADLVVLDDDPLADVAALGDVSAVYKSGERVAG